MRVAIVILNWNGKTHLSKFLPSVIKNSPHADIYLADNASTDDSVDFIKQNYPSVTIITNNRNHGFAGGYNEALRSVGSDVFVLLNSDVEVTPNWIEPVLQRLKEPNVAACQPKVLSYTQRTKFEHAGAAGGFIDKDAYPFCRGRIFETAETDTGQYNEAREIFWATGACMFIKADLFWKAGAFDARFFAHMEEIDLCWRLKRMGYKIYVEPASCVYHLGGGTLNYMSPRKTYLNFRNNLFMLHKNYPGLLFPKVFRRLILDGIAGCKFLFGGQFRHFWKVVLSHLHYYGNLKYLNRERRRIRNMSTRDHVSCVYNRSIVLTYFIRGKKRFSSLDENQLA